MSTKIKIKRGSGTTPTLADGELGFNKSSKILTIGTDSGNVDVGRPILTMTQAEYNAATKDEDAIYIIESDDVVVTESILDAGLATKAPAGFGLGGDSKWVEDLNDAKNNGFYCWTDSAANKPFAYGVLLALKRGERTTQIAIDPLMNGHGGRVMRHWNGSTWSSWMWDNPPLYAGTEYLTTERYGGNPVYVKYVIAACNQSDSSNVVDVKIPHGISNFGKLIKVDANINGTFALPSISGIDQLSSVNTVDSTNIVFRCCRDSWAGSTLNAILYYTKT